MPVGSTSRFQSVDALRGFIMIVMAIDHANFFVARQHSSEFWAGAMTAYASAFPFLTRAVTHLCAPGFFFLVGASIVWFAESRRRAGWTDGMIMRRLAVRGMALFLVGQILENPAMFIAEVVLKAPSVALSVTAAPPPGDGSAPYLVFLVMSGLGLVMIVCSLLLRGGIRVWAIGCSIAVFATNSLLPATCKPGPPWETILLVPGTSEHFLVVYAVAPWFAVSAAGMCFGLWWSRSGDSAPKLTPLVGLAMVLAGIGLRLAGGWGNIGLPRDAGWIEFFNNVKYPPSLVFWLLSVGVDLLLLSLLLHLPALYRSARSPLMVLGQTPLFFYLAHLWLLAAIGVTFFREPAPLWMTYPVWLAALIVLYPACLRYRGFKMSKPADSMWRMF